MTVITYELKDEDILFRAWPKTPRLNREIVITEKIDGTNAAIGITTDGRIYAQSRTQLITPEQDNHGFAKWVADNAGTLTDDLGPGLHFGEWWGSGINRGYGLPKGEKRFSLFNTRHWRDCEDGFYTPNLRVVPVLTQPGALWSQVTLNLCLEELRFSGSFAAPGYMKPEGVCIFHVAAQQVFKVTLENDAAPKGHGA